MPVIARKLFHRILRQLAESDFARLPAADLPIAVEGLALQHFLAEAVKGVLLVFVVAVRCHCLTSLLAGRQVISSPFAHYSSAGDLFWPVCLKKFQKNFFATHLVCSFRFVQVDRTGSKRKGGERHRGGHRKTPGQHEAVRAQKAIYSVRKRRFSQPPLDCSCRAVWIFLTIAKIPSEFVGG